MVKSAIRGVTVGLNESQASIAVSDPDPVALDWVTISGYLMDLTAGVPISGASVDLLLNGAYEASQVTNSAGYYEFSANFEEGHYSLQVRYLGDSVHEADWSAVLTVDAWRPTSSITVAVSPSRGAPPLEVSITGRITRDDLGSGISVEVHLYRDDVDLESKFAGVDGIYTFTDTLTDMGGHIYYTEFKGNLKFQGCENVVLPCPACRHPVSIPDRGAEVVCGFCGARSEVVIDG